MARGRGIGESGRDVVRRGERSVIDYPRARHLMGCTCSAPLCIAPTDLRAAHESASRPPGVLY
jgi:hypothetical protein